MLPRDVEARVAAIAADRVSGASELTLRAVESFEALEDVRSVETLKELAARLEAAQPSMAAVRNVAHLCAQLLAEGGDPAVVLREVRREIEGAQDRIARNALKVFTGHPTILTLSRSAAVVAACRFLRSRDRLAAVYVLESRPQLEGRRAAEELTAAGIPTTLIADAFGSSLAREVDAVLVGADTVLRDGALVNKIGTYALALAAKAAGRPFYGACEVLKIDATHTAETVPRAERRDPRELGAPANVEALNVYFDVTPAALVTSYITDKGVYEPRRIAQLVLL